MCSRPVLLLGKYNSHFRPLWHQLRPVLLLELEKLAHFDISLVALESWDSQRRELGSKFTQLSGDLREHAQGNGGKGRIHTGKSRRNGNL